MESTCKHWLLKQACRMPRKHWPLRWLYVRLASLRILSTLPLVQCLCGWHWYCISHCFRRSVRCWPRSQSDVRAVKKISWKGSPAFELARSGFFLGIDAVSDLLPCNMAEPMFALSIQSLSLQWACLLPPKNSHMIFCITMPTNVTNQRFVECLRCTTNLIRGARCLK